MRHVAILTRSPRLLALCVLAQSVSVAAAHPLDLSKESLAAAVAGAREKDTVIPFTGVCAGPIVITTDGLTLQGLGHGRDRRRRAGCRRCCGCQPCVARRNRGPRRSKRRRRPQRRASDARQRQCSPQCRCVLLQTGSSGVLSEVAIQRNGLHGLDLQSGSAATITGSLTSTANCVFGVNVNGSSITFATAIVTASQNARGSASHQCQRLHQRSGHGAQRRQQPRHRPDGRRA